MHWKRNNKYNVKEQNLYVIEIFQRITDRNLLKKRQTIFQRFTMRLDLEKYQIR